MPPAALEPVVMVWVPLTADPVTAPLLPPVASEFQKTSTPFQQPNTVLKPGVLPSTSQWSCACAEIPEEASVAVANAAVE